VYLGSLVSGAWASFTATVSIFLFGEIIPQAAFSRHALWVGARFAPLIKLLLIIAAPISLTISYILNRLLGDELPTVYSQHELMQIVEEHADSEHIAIDANEKRIATVPYNFHTPPCAK